MKHLFQRKAAPAPLDTPLADFAPPRESNQDLTVSVGPREDSDEQHIFPDGRRARPAQQSNGRGPGGPPRVENVTAVIGYSCASTTFDYPYLLALCDYISLSSAASKDAARALRKELKYGAPAAQERAIRLMGILARNADIRFKQEIASKRFLSEVADLATGKKTDPTVRQMVLRVLSPLAYEYQRDADLNAITALYNRLKPQDEPMNGLPLDPEDSLFTPTSTAPRRSAQSEVPTEQAQMNSLRMEAEAARGNAGMLSEALGYASAAELGSDLIKEFYAKCFDAQQLIQDNLPWATVQAENSRAALPAAAPAPQPLSPGAISRAAHLASNNPFAAVIDGVAPAAEPPHAETEAEATLAILLLANHEIYEALELHTRRFRTANEQAELDSVQERSKKDIRFDREQAGQPDSTGAYFAENETPQPYAVPAARTTPPQLIDVTDTPSPASPAVETPVKNVSKNPYASYLASPVASPPQSPAPPPTNNPYRQTPPPAEAPIPVAASQSNYDFDFLDSYASPNETNLQLPIPPSRAAVAHIATTEGTSASRVAEEDEEDEPVTPLHPSEKSLGKMRSASYTQKDL